MRFIPQPFPWTEYSKKLTLRIETPYCIGKFSQEDALSRAMHYSRGVAGDVAEGNMVTLSWLVDPTDGVIIDARFQVFGDSVLIGASEICCELVVGKNYDQASRLTADHIDKHVQDKNEHLAFPKVAWSHINLVIEAIHHASDGCTGIPLSEQYIAPSLYGSHTVATNEGGWPGWKEMDTKKRLQVLEHVISEDIRPYIELDAGGVEVINILNNNEVIIAYQGSCTTCFSATGATLSYIQHVLRAKISEDIVVTPNL